MPDNFNTLSQPTIADVARIAGVSVSTVSRVLNDKPDVSEKTRQRVRQVIDTLGYKPYVQVTPRITRPLTFSVNYPLERYSAERINWADTHFFGGMGQAAAETDFTLNISTHRLTADALARAWGEGQMDGMILMETDQHDWRIDVLRGLGCPFVMIGRQADNNGLSYVDLDSGGAVPQVFDHLVSLGHRHIGFLAHPEAVIADGFTPAVHTMRAYEAVLARHDLPRYLHHAAFGSQGSFTAARTLLRHHPALTALVTVDGMGVTGAVQAILEQGHRVPETFSLAGLVVSTHLAAMVLPALTAISFPSYHLGYEAVQMLHRLLQGGGIEQKLLPAELTIRESTGPLR